MPTLFVSSEKRFVNQGCHKRLYRHMLFWIILSTFSKLLAPPRAVLQVYCILPSSLCSLKNMCTCLERFTNKSFLTLKLLFQFQALADQSLEDSESKKGSTAATQRESLLPAQTSLEGWCPDHCNMWPGGKRPGMTDMRKIGACHLYWTHYGHI